MKFSVILTAANEERTIAKAITNIADSKFSGADWQNGELILVIPDKKTIAEAKNYLSKNFPKIPVIFLVDPHKGKPFALNLAFEQAKGDILVLTDGDVYLGKNSIALLLNAFNSNPKLGGVTGRPISRHDRQKFWDYISNMLADGAHHKRVASMRRDIGGNSLKLISNSPGFFVMSGYVSAIRNLGFRLANDTLVDDAYLSYLLINKGYNIAYIPEATASVKYPTNIHDWYLQKIRSVGGYMQLYKYHIVPKDKKVRNIWKELEYFWFPIQYARSFKELLWSLCLYPIRLWMWIRIFWVQKIQKREFYQIWERVESTK